MFWKGLEKQALYDFVLHLAGRWIHIDSHGFRSKLGTRGSANPTQNLCDQHEPFKRCKMQSGRVKGIQAGFPFSIHISVAYCYKCIHVSYINIFSSLQFCWPTESRLKGCSTRIKSILPSMFQSTIRGRRKSVRFAVTRSKGLSSTNWNWPSESWRKWRMGFAKSEIRRSKRPSWSQSATLKCPHLTISRIARKGFS